jgi:YVTN family beta-propeller protein
MGLLALFLTLLFLDVARAFAIPIYVTSTYSAHYPRVLDGNAVSGQVYVGRVAPGSTGDVVVLDDSVGSVITTVALPHQPQAIAINEATGQTYVVAWAPHDKLYRLDGASHAMTEVVASSLDFYRLHVAVNPNDNRVYLSGYQELPGNLYDMYLSVFDGNTLTYSPTLHLGQTGFMEPEVLVVTSTNKVYVRVPAGVMVIDSATALTTTIPLGSIYGTLAADPLSGKVYAADALNQQVVTIDGLSDSIVATATVGITPTSIAVNPLTNLAYVANYGDGTVSVIDGASGTVTETITIGGVPRKVEVDLALNRVYVATSTRLKAIDGATHSVYEPDLVFQTGGDFAGFQDLLVMPSHKVYLADRNGLAADGHWYVLADIDLAASTITANPDQLPVDGASTSALTTTLRDSLGAPVAGVPVTLSVGGSQNSLSGAYGVTDAAGQTGACLWSALAEAKPVTATLAEGKALTTPAVVTFTAPPPTVTAASAVQGGNIAYSHPSGAAANVAIPAGAVTTTTVLRYTPQLTPATQPAGLQFAGLAFQLDAFRDCGPGAGLDFQAPVTATLQYPDPAGSDLDEGSLGLWRWTGQAWSTAGIMIVERQAGANQLVVTLSHAAPVALFGANQPPEPTVFELYLPLVFR